MAAYGDNSIRIDSERALLSSAIDGGVWCGACGAARGWANVITRGRDRMSELYLASNGLAGIVSNAMIQLVGTVKQSMESYLPFLRYQPWLCKGSNVIHTILWQAVVGG